MNGMHGMPVGVGWGAALAVIVLVVYYFFMARTILDMLRRPANTAVLVFALIALIPLPPTVIMGIVLMIIWSIHAKS